MYTYNMTQWLAFLIIYSFLGWIWECCYVSVRKKKWVNRGFLHGPLLPIYGSGAVIVLWAALPFKGNLPAVYLAGMISATILEYCTGAAMEAIFKVRYWDYSKNRFNLHGHICLFCSLGWGFFSIAMVYVLHEPFERAVLSIPEMVLSPVVHIIMMLASADFGISFKTAIELRDVLAKLEMAKKEAQLMQKRIEVYEAFLAEDLQLLNEKRKEEMKEIRESLRKKRENVSELRDEELHEFVEMLREKKESIVSMSEERKEKMRLQFIEEREEMQKRLSVMHLRIEEHRHMKPDFERMLRRNPGADSRKYKAALEDLKRWMH